MFIRLLHKKQRFIIFRMANVFKNELRKLRDELGELGGAGHFFGNDKEGWFGGDREPMGEEELKMILQLLSFGEKKINLKEREFRAIFSEKNGEKLKKSLIFGTIAKSPRQIGRSSSSLIRNVVEGMESTTIFGWKEKVKLKFEFFFKFQTETQNSRRLWSKLTTGMEK